MRLGVALCMLLLPACYDQATEGVETPDRDAYGLVVHPVVERSCGTLDCHGNPGRPLRIYSENGLRLRDDLRGDPITDEELGHDVLAFSGLSATHASADEHLALLKPLAVDEGGLHHVGRDLWDTLEHDGYRCLSQWLSGSTDDAAFVDACTREFERLDALGF